MKKKTSIGRMKFQLEDGAAELRSLAYQITAPKLRYQNQYLLAARLIAIAKRNEDAMRGEVGHCKNCDDTGVDYPPKGAL